ncbi:MAG: PEFG-CTERM sorting domain-containing protein [Nitrosotalea sp.]
MRLQKTILAIVLVAAFVIGAPLAIHPAEAHILKTFNMTGTMPGMPSHVSVKIGWLNEPPLQGDTNQFQIYIYNGTDDSAPPIADTGLDNVTVTVQYGGQTKDFTSFFSASDDTPGLYTAAMRPTQLGTYNLIIKGNIDGVTIPPTTYPMQDVEAKDKYYFPPMTGQNQQMTNTATQSQTNQAVPEFGPVASLVLVIAIISAVVFTGRMRGFLKLTGS